MLIKKAAEFPAKDQPAPGIGKRIREDSEKAIEIPVLRQKDPGFQRQGQRGEGKSVSQPLGIIGKGVETIGSLGDCADMSIVVKDLELCYSH